MWSFRVGSGMGSEHYLSVALQTTGRAPSTSSILSIGAVLFQPGSECLQTFNVNLLEEPDRPGDASSWEFWDKNPNEYGATRIDPVPIRTGMEWFRDWLKPVPKPSLVGYPVCFDFMFLMDYWTGTFPDLDPPWGLTPIDIGSVGAGLLGIPPGEMSPDCFPHRWVRDLPPVTHHALDDAIRRARVYQRIHAELVGKKEEAKWYREEFDRGFQDGRSNRGARPTSLPYLEGYESGELQFRKHQHWLGHTPGVGSEFE